LPYHEAVYMLNSPVCFFFAFNFENGNNLISDFIGFTIKFKLVNTMFFGWDVVQFYLSFIKP
jgi:hypothetical protein